MHYKQQELKKKDGFFLKFLDMVHYSFGHGRVIDEKGNVLADEKS